MIAIHEFSSYVKIGHLSGYLQMTRSAPPERTHAHTKHAYNAGERHSTTARAHRIKSAKYSNNSANAISVEDIYKSAERERLHYSVASRRQNLAHAQSKTQFFRHENNTASPRPHTSGSRHMPSPRKRDTNTPMSAWSEPVMSRPSSIIPHPELRDLLENDDADADTEDTFTMSHHTPLTVTFSPVGRDCCEIIGPQLCYECRKNRIREVSRQRSDVFFPMLEPTEENLTTAAIVRKYLPGMSEAEIETKLARGEIARPSMFRKQAKQIEFSDEESEPKPKITNKKVTIVEHGKDRTDGQTNNFKKKVNELFFTNIRDLNYKIVRGDVARNVGFSEAARAIIKPKDKQEGKSIYPAFVSPRKVTMVQKTHYKTYFEPPLIAKDKQSVEPAFFAGSAGEYKLPDKLPDELVFVDKEGNEVKASSSSGFTNKQAASSEGPIVKKHGSGNDSNDISDKVSNVSSSSGLTRKTDDKLEVLTDLKEEEEEEEEQEEEEENPRFLSTGESVMETVGEIQEASED
ncbi:uncharacterized protein LOC127868367 isoform X2 [Dreissena polymorpha]|uniref:uncharacterized protein LOC127868367 isoform X2 n=1 Tax=Dreissena polymorpha TaxID=45954 RepID=UPI00226526DA|nr:uncharacterized protein LOC127868367 isoform X2 [Dreissena polymorpha]